MLDLNGSLTRGPRVSVRRTPTRIALALGAMGMALGACHSSTTAPRTASSITVLSGAAQTGTVGAALAAPVVLQVKDQSGNSLPGVSVTVTAGTGSGSVSATQMTTDGNGQVSVSWTLGTVAGTDTLVAQVASLAALDVVATATPDVPASIAIVTGDDQTGQIGTALAAPLTVKVVDRYGNPVPNVTVTFADDANGTLAATTVTTDASGMASDTITLGPNAGTDDVTASIQTSSGPVTVTMHETAS